MQNCLQATLPLDCRKGSLGVTPLEAFRREGEADIVCVESGDAFLHQHHPSCHHALFNIFDHLRFLLQASLIRADLLQNKLQEISNPARERHIVPTVLLQEPQGCNGSDHPHQKAP